MICSSERQERARNRAGGSNWCLNGEAEDKNGEHVAASFRGDEVDGESTRLVVPDHCKIVFFIIIIIIFLNV